MRGQGHEMQYRCVEDNVSSSWETFRPLENPNEFLTGLDGHLNIGHYIYLHERFMRVKFSETEGFTTKNNCTPSLFCDEKYILQLITAKHSERRTYLFEDLRSFTISPFVCQEQVVPIMAIITARVSVRDDVYKNFLCFLFSFKLK